MYYDVEKKKSLDDIETNQKINFSYKKFHCERINGFEFSESTLFKWLNSPKNKKYVRRRFLIFLFGVIDKHSGLYFYLEQLKNFYFHRKTSFYIYFEHLVVSDPLLSIWLTDEPEIILEIFKNSCEEVLKDIFRKFKESFYISIRLKGFPICESMRNLKKKKLNSLVKIRGTIVTKTQIFPTIGFFHLICLKCLEVQEILFSTVDQKSKKIKNCFNCKSLGPFQTKWHKFVENKFQKITIKEELNEESFRWLPYSLDILLTGDLIDHVEYGDRVEITGILKYSIIPKPKQIRKYPFFFMLIEANSIQKTLNLKKYWKISLMETKTLEKIVNEKNLFSYLLFSFIPEIFRNYFLKLSILLTFCSSGEKNRTSTEVSRNILNMMVTGNQCTGKSRILKAIFKYFPKSYFLNGYGSSIKGLTTSLKYDKVTSEWVPEGGVLSISKGHLYLIDSLEGMNTKDMVSLLNILDQQYMVLIQHQIKREIVLTTPTIATFNIFNPIPSPSLPFFLNNGLEESVLSKFDIIFKMEKNQDSNYEANLAKFLINSFCHPSSVNQDPKINYFFSQSFIIRYLEYCRNNFSPKFGKIDQSFLLKFYLDLKRETRRLNSINFSSNFLETILRIVSSSAKLHLRNFVSEKDLAIGLIVFFDSWIQFQPFFTGSFLKSKYKRFFGNIFKKFKDFSIFLNKY